MAVDLRGCGGELRVGWPAWGYCFEVAKAFGWKPEGTAPPYPYTDEALKDEEASVAVNPDGNLAQWGGGYFTNDFQRLTGTDAKALAAALDRAAVAVETGLPLSVQQRRAFIEERDPFPAAVAALAKAFDGAVEVHAQRPRAFDTEVLRLLADYARQGEFIIG
jgi:hypothetical protein